METKRKDVAAIVSHNGRILLGRKRDDSTSFLRGLWHVPGETLEEGESFAGALQRGMLEEAGIKVTVGEYLGSSESPQHSEVRWYECFTEDPEVVAGSDLSEVEWVLPSEVVKRFEEVMPKWPVRVKEYFK